MGKEIGVIGKDLVLPNMFPFHQGQEESTERLKRKKGKQKPKNTAHCV